MKTIKYTILPICLLLAINLTQSCNAPGEASSTKERNEAETGQPSIRDYSILTVLWQQHAAEYRALAYQAFNFATDRLDQVNFEEERKLPPCIIIDIDETVLDNSPYNAQLVFDNQNYETESWQGWTEQKKAGPVPGALDFLEHATSLGIRIFYVSNRKEAEFDATIANMEKLGFPQLEAENFMLRTETSSKRERRLSIAMEHEILLLLGDNLSDFSDIFDKQSTEERRLFVDQQQEAFGRRFIVLPNPMYGDWEGALYDNNWGMEESEKQAVRSRLLKGFKQ